MNILDFLKLLNFEDFDYFYHETGAGVGMLIMEEGLLVDGTNILNTNNVAYTTVAPLLPEMVKDPKDFVTFIERERSSNPNRTICEMVILSTSKEVGDNLVEPYEVYRDGNYYEGIIRKNCVMGVLDMDSLEFELNENFEYADELYDYSDFQL